MGLFMELLILVPILMAIVVAVISNTKVRAAVMYVFCACLAILSVYVAVSWVVAGGEAVSLNLPHTAILDKVILVGDFALMFLVCFLSFKNKKPLIALLSIVQTCFVGALEIFEEPLGLELVESESVRFDWLTFVMVLVIGIVGVAIAVYAVGYMHGYHRHHMKHIEDRRGFFFAMMFVFYGAMFGLVFSQSLIWLYFFWEVTSVCSFLLIGYTKTSEAIANSYRALWMNLLGGAGIAAAIGFAMYYEATVNLYQVIDIAIFSNAYYGIKLGLVPIALLAFAALTKSAQLPFSKWLLGAMVAPTPSSTLLHSATMVKAGVYLLIRISMAMAGNEVGMMVSLVGGITFFAASCLAISQSDGKKVLAYSTISNLGLMVACAGAGQPETIWACIFLLIFHAVAKSMLFQVVGAIENTTESRNIETMQGLAMKYPKLGFILMLGISGMFLAPFGMLVSKWAALKAFVDLDGVVSIVMVILVSFGSATTMFYWTKWLSKILGNKREEAGRDLTKPNEYVSMFISAVVLLLLCVSFPLLAKFYAENFISDMFGSSVQVMSSTNIMIMAIMIVGIFIVPAINAIIASATKKKEVIAYMGGANAGDNKHFINSFGTETELKMSNMYFYGIFSEEKFLTPSIVVGAVVLLVFLTVIIGGAFA